ncbi:uncharacterized protein LOC134250578 [Saccostrea cucullata]|uniref:uncharacterized protein LOC134250578 n=2 Tax=Saccostrea cuccullata TaxID=36930 RepID=UPI002ECFEF5B
MEVLIDPIHGSGGQNADVMEIKQMVLNLTTEVEYLERQIDIIPVLKQNLTVVGEEKKANEERNKNLTLRLSEAENNIAICDKKNENLTQRLSEVYNVSSENKENNKELTQQLTNSVNNLHNMKIQMRYTSLSLLDLHSKADKLNTTLTRNVDDQIRDVYDRIT